MAQPNISSVRARELVEQVILNQDPFGTHIAALQQIPRALVEAWTPDRKSEIVQKAARNGLDLVDHAVAGDYDLTLWHTRAMEGYEHAYMVSINNAQHDPLEATTQQGKFAATANRLPLRTIKNKLEDWVESYGPILVGSYIPDRNPLYLRLVRHLLADYQFQEIYPGDDFTHGFRLDLPPTTQGEKNA